MIHEKFGWFENEDFDETWHIGGGEKRLLT